MNQTELKHILSTKFDFDIWKELLNTLFPKVELFNKEVEVDASLIKQGGHVGNVRLDDGRSLAIFRFEVADSVQIARNRRGLRDIAAKYVDQSLIHGALVFYYSLSQEDYRLTYIAKQTVFDENGQLKTNETAPKRYTFILGPNETCTTAANRLFELAERKRKKDSVYLADVTDAFSVERLNKEFFDGYKKQYNKFLATLSDSKQNRDYVKKLLGRIVFLHFLQKKGWMGVPASNPGWEGGDRNYLANLIDRYNGNDRLLSDVLEPLFFNTLNEKRENDIADSMLGDNIKIPYLNGGLFEKDNIDRLDIDFPYSYFKELMDFFSMYNFTIDENDPEDSEVGIDPEMLGHIFENLLEDNKDKGAFYTPKEIVQYMSKESVAQYLKSNTPNELHTAIDSLVKQRVVEAVLQKKENARMVNKALTTVKVCDPAIGSGAFPMGVLNVLFDCRHLLYGFIGINETFSYAKVKRDIIQNNIYGVDIEQGAVDIARLRFWLALVVDENEPQPLPNLDYKIMCGNSLLHRFALDTPFKSVLRDYNQKNGTKYTIDDYRQWVYDYTDISDHTKKYNFHKKIEDIKHAVKTELSDNEKGKISKVRGTIANLQSELIDIFGVKKKENEKKIKELKKKLVELEKQREEIESNKIYENAFEWRFEFPQMLDDDGNFIGFDIVIGNPPYFVYEAKNKDELKILRKDDDYKIAFGGKLNAYKLFLANSQNKLAKTNGITCFIFQNSFLADKQAAELRKYILSNNQIIKIDSFPERDSKKKRVFENVKMSVCIVIIQNSYSDKPFVVNVWNDKDKKTGITTIFTKEDIMSIDKDCCSIPRLLQKDVHLVSKINSISYKIDIRCYQGELNMTSHRSYFTMDKTKPMVLKGASIQRYYWTLNMSQGIIEYVDAERYLSDFSKSDKAQHHIFERLVMQGMTGANDKIRIVATIIPKGVYLAHSCNYIIPQKDIDIKCLLGIVNSKLYNWYFRLFSTNSNVNSYEIESIPIPAINELDQQKIIDIVNTIFAEKRKNEKNNTEQLENMIDFIVYQLYGLTYDEVLVVDPETHITRDEYDLNKL